MLVRLIDVMLPAGSLRYTEAVEEIARFDDEGRPVKRDAMTEEEFNALCIAIAKLPPQHRKVLMLRFFFASTPTGRSPKHSICRSGGQHHLSRTLEAVHTARAILQVDRAYSGRS